MLPTYQKYSIIQVVTMADLKIEKGSSPSLETPQHHEAPEASREPKGSHEVRSQATEVLGDSESTEEAEGDGRVSENTSEDKSKQSQGTGKSSKNMTDDEKEQLRARLLASPPTPERMQADIRKVLKKQEHVLEGEISSLKKQAHKNAYQLTQVMGQLRVVKDYFNQLAKATYEVLKHLWLKIVHGV